MKRWRARLAVAGDPGAQAEQAGGAEEGEEEEGAGGGAEGAPPACGEYEFVAEGERRGQGREPCKHVYSHRSCESCRKSQQSALPIVTWNLAEIFNVSCIEE